MFYVVVIDELGIPSRLIGPRDWNGAMDKAQEILGKLGIEMNSGICEGFDEGYGYMYEDGGGVFIIRAVN